MHRVYDDYIQVFFCIFYKIACIPYDFCCFCCVNIDEHFVVYNFVKDVIAVEYYDQKKLVLGSLLLPSSNVKKQPFASIGWTTMI